MHKFYKNCLTGMRIAYCIFLLICMNCCSDNNNGSNSSANNSRDNLLVVGVAADYPPFEFIQNGEFKGLDIDLINLIGKSLGRKIQFKDLNYSNLFAALNAGQIDVAISTITFTEARNRNFDLSNPYHWSDIALIFKKDYPIKQISDLRDKTVGAQLGSTMEMWAIDCGQPIKLISMDVSLQLIEALKSNQLDVVVSEAAQAKEFCNSNSDLGYLVIAKSSNGYVIALKKGSKLLPEINDALRVIQQNDKFNELKNKWLDIVFETEVHDAS